MGWRIHEGESLAVLQSLPSDGFDCIVTSPPYWRLRDYGHPEQLGLEDLDRFIARLGEIASELLRVLAPKGTFWLNIGDCYSAKGGGRAKGSDMGRRYLGTPRRSAPGIQTGELVGVPWMIAFELRRRGWMICGEQIWSKSNPIPEANNCRRPHRSHEHVFLFVRRKDHYYNIDGVRTPLSPKTLTTIGSTRKSKGHDGSGHVKAHNIAQSMKHHWVRLDADGNPVGAALRSVWHLPTHPISDDHFAAMPPGIAELCLLVGCPPGGAVLDPFAGRGTTGIVAQRLGLNFLGIELVPRYAAMARSNISSDAPLLQYANDT